MGGGLSAPFGAMTQSMTGLLSSNGGEGEAAQDLTTSWQNGSLLFRMGMIGVLLIGGFLFKAAPKILAIILDKLPEKKDAIDGGEAGGRNLGFRRAYTGDVDAPQFGITEGGDVQISPELISVHGFGPSGLALGSTWIVSGLRIVLFGGMFAFLGFAWAVVLVLAGMASSPTAHALGAAMLFVAIPFLSVFADGVIRVLTTAPATLEIYSDEIELLKLEPFKGAARLVARIKKPGQESGEFRFFAKRAQSVDAVLAELESLSGMKSLAVH